MDSDDVVDFVVGGAVFDGADIHDFLLGINLNEEFGGVGEFLVDNGLMQGVTQRLVEDDEGTGGGLAHELAAEGEFALAAVCGVDAVDVQGASELNIHDVFAFLFYAWRPVGGRRPPPTGATRCFFLPPPIW